MILDESLDTVADGHDAVLLDEGCCISFEEGLGGGGLIGHDDIDHRDLLAVSGLNEAGLEGDDLDVDVVSTAGGLDILHFDELGLCQDCFLTHTC